MRHCLEFWCPEVPLPKIDVGIDVPAVVRIAHQLIDAVLCSAIVAPVDRGIAIERVLVVRSAAAGRRVH